jgi:hypothetical protein
MKLITEEIKRKMPRLYSTEKVPTADKVAVVKFFNPTGIGTWYVIEGDEQEDGDWLFFGFVDLLEKEWGYFTLSELEAVRLPFGLGIERDLYFDGRIPA